MDIEQPLPQGRPKSDKNFYRANSHLSNKAQLNVFMSAIQIIFMSALYAAVFTAQGADTVQMIVCLAVNILVGCIKFIFFQQSISRIYNNSNVFLDLAEEMKHTVTNELTTANFTAIYFCYSDKIYMSQGNSPSQINSSIQSKQQNKKTSRLLHSVIASKFLWFRILQCLYYFLSTLSIFYSIYALAIDKSKNQFLLYGILFYFTAQLLAILKFAFQKLTLLCDDKQQFPIQSSNNQVVIEQ